MMRIDAIGSQRTFVHISAAENHHALPTQAAHDIGICTGCTLDRQAIGHRPPADSNVVFNHDWQTIEQTRRAAKGIALLRLDRLRNSSFRIDKYQRVYLIVS